MRVNTPLSVFVTGFLILSLFGTGFCANNQEISSVSEQPDSTNTLDPESDPLVSPLPAGSITDSSVWASTEMDQSASIAWGDYDNDGDLDLVVGNIGGPNRVYQNNGMTLLQNWLKKIKLNCENLDCNYF